MRLFLYLFLLIQCFAFSQSEVIFSPAGGNYPELKKVDVQIPDGWSVYYTENGKLPNKSSKKVINSISIHGDVALFFAMYKDNNPPIYTTNTYITSRKQSLPIWSIITDPAHLFDSLNGIYEMGCCANVNLPFKGANFWKDIEKPIYIEFIENNSKVFSQAAGIKIFGGYSVSMPQKSFAIYARKKYGINSFDYPLFPQLPFEGYKNFVLRNAGGDMQGAHIRDAFATQLTKNSGLAYQEYRPVVVYINGKYWGIYNLREKINEHFINAHVGIKKSNISIIRPPNKVQDGPKKGLEDYRDLMRFIQGKEKLNNSDIDKIKKEIDINDYLKYSVIQIYLGNSDASGNIRLYKDIENKTAFKTVLFDLDMTLNIFDENKHEENSLRLFTSTVDTNIQYPTQYTLLLRKLLTNDSIRNHFINYFIDAINTYFNKEESLRLLTQLTKERASEINFHRKRWNVTDQRYIRSIDRMETFIKQRPNIMLRHLKEYFTLNETFELKVKASKGGKVHLNSLVLSSDYSAQYFKEIPIQFEAIPDDNYEFIGWKNIENKSPKQNIVVNVDQYVIEPIFRAKKPPSYFNKIILSELNVSQPKGADYEDWIEIYNTSDETIDLSNWILKDSKGNHEFTIQSGIKILPNSYLIITKNKNKFIKRYGNYLYVVGDIPFGFNAKDKIKLYDASGFLVIHLDLSQLQKLEDKTNSWIRIKTQPTNSIEEKWIESFPCPGIKTYDIIGKKTLDRSKYITNTLVFIGIIVGLLVIILFFLKLAAYIGKDKT